MSAETSVSGLFRIASSHLPASGETIPPILSQVYPETQRLEVGGPWEMKQSHLLILEVRTMRLEDKQWTFLIPQVLHPFCFSDATSTRLENQPGTNGKAFLVIHTAFCLPSWLPQGIHQSAFPSTLQTITL